jgi:two-component system NarL family sensor kinase
MGVTGSPDAHWTTVAVGHVDAADVPFDRRRLVLRVLAMALAVAVIVVVAANLVARQVARTAAVDSAVQRTSVLVDDVVQPTLSDGVVLGRSEAIADLDTIVRTRVLASDVRRIKVTRADGSIVYSDEPRLIGRHFPLGPEESKAIEHDGSAAEISDLTDPDNLYERGHGPLLEVSRAMRTPNGTPLLFEVYFGYDAVTAQENGLWLRLSAVTTVSLLLLLIALMPLFLRLVRSLDRGREQRELLLRRAVDASDAERRRIAALLHDGPVQELVGASYFIGAAGATVVGTDAGRTLDEAETTVRATVQTLRALLLDIYPPALTESGLGTALELLAESAEARGAPVTVEVPPALPLSVRAEQLLFRVAREAITNAVKHGRGCPVTVRVTRERDTTVLTVADDGPGFDAEALIAAPPSGHFGLRLLRDVVVDAGLDATLAVRSAPGAGATWRLTVRH